MVVDSFIPVDKGPYPISIKLIKLIQALPRRHRYSTAHIFMQGITCGRHIGRIVGHEHDMIAAADEGC